jgi:hypothetical protein
MQRKINFNWFPILILLLSEADAAILDVAGAE